MKRTHKFLVTVFVLTLSACGAPDMPPDTVGADQPSDRAASSRDGMGMMSPKTGEAFEYAFVQPQAGVPRAYEFVFKIKIHALFHVHLDVTHYAQQFTGIDSRYDREPGDWVIPVGPFPTGTYVEYRFEAHVGDAAIDSVAGSFRVPD